MTFKQKFENHPVIFGLSLLLAGGVGGFGIRGYVLPIPKDPTSCYIEGLPALEQSVEKQLAPLNSNLMSLESRASDPFTISQYQQVYRDSANRVREDIGRVNFNRLAAIDRLEKRCK